MIELILGGARSGKSRYAEQVATESGLPVIYVATAEARDKEMQARINLHQDRRPEQWETIEEPIKLAEIVQKYSGTNVCLLVDCLTLWLTNILFDREGNIQQSIFEKEAQALYQVLSHFSGQLIFVTNEVGLGIVPMDKMTRRFVDEAGLLHQRIATLSDKVVLVTAGLPQKLK